MAKKFDTQVGVAQSWIEEFLTTNGVEKQPEQSIAPNKLNNGNQVAMANTGFKIPPLSYFIDKGSLGFSVFIESVTNGIGFWVMGPDVIMKFAMLGVSIVIVLFSVRALIKRSFVLWGLLAVIAVFTETSFVLVATDVQSKNASEDTVMKQLNDQLEKAQNYLDVMQSKQIEAGSGYRDQVTEATNNRDMAQKRVDEWMSRPVKVDKKEMTANAVATAIPDAIMSGSLARWIFLGLFLLVTIAMQLTIVSASGVKFWQERS